MGVNGNIDYVKSGIGYHSSSTIRRLCAEPVCVYDSLSENSFPDLNKNSEDLSLPKTITVQRAIEEGRM